MSEPRAAATGNLATTPVPELLVYALDHALDGTLVLEEPDGKKSAILFDSGAPAKVKTAAPIAYLGQVLVEQASIDRAAYERALADAVQQRKLFGQVLLEHGSIRQRALQEGLREQVIQKVSALFKLPGETVFGFYAGADFLARWGGEPTRVKPLPLMWRGLRLFSDDAKVEALIARLGERQLKLYFQAPIGRFKLTPQERGVVDLLRGRPAPLSTLLSSGLGSPTLVKRVVYALCVTRQLDFGVPGVEPLGLDEAPSSSSMPVFQPEAAGGRSLTPSFNPRPMVPSQADAGQRSSAQPKSPEHATFEQELRARAEDSGQSYYEVLGVSESDSTSTIQAAFFQLAKVWHPDRLPAELSELRELSTKVFARISEAHQLLIDPARRREYDQLLESGGGSAEEQEKVAQVVQAVAAFQRAEVLLKKRDFAGAEREALAAMQGDPEQADYKALYAWVCAQQPRKSYDELLRLLNQALEAEPGNQRALWYRGQLYKRSQDDKRALRDFKKLLELNPKHLDAQREMRLYEMRRSQPKEEKGLLGKWFKR